MKRKHNSKWDIVLSNIHQPPKNLKLDFIVGMSGEDFLRLDSKTDNLYYINFSCPFTLNKNFYNNETTESDWVQLKVLIGKKIISAKFVNKNKGDVELIFNSGDELIIHELEQDVPYESYTMQTPEGLVVV